METIATSRTHADNLRPDQLRPDQLRPERRAAPRTTRKIRVLILPDDCALEEPYAGWIVDSSTGGVRLAIERTDIAVGAIVRVRQPGASRRSPWMIARVKNRRHLGDVFMLGCELVRARVPQAVCA